MIAGVKRSEIRTYNRQECITFRKTNEKFGGLSNMAGGYPLNVNGVKILTSEALYQACRFPHLPEIQRQIIAERSPMTAKMRSKPHRDNSRPDWNIVRTKIMRWCLQVKLVQNWDKFSKLLLATGDLPIVEDSYKDDFWGAKPQDDKTLIGVNVLGRLLMQLREQVKNEEITSQSIIIPLSMANFLLYSQEINPIYQNVEHCPSQHQEPSEPKELLNQFDVNFIYSDLSLTNIPTQELHFDCDKYDSLQFVLPYIVESLQDAELTDKELADLFKVQLNQMREWLKRLVELHKIKKLSKPVRYIAESQLSLFS